jgi:ABC-2 type transport system ATP-binding protein
LLCFGLRRRVGEVGKMIEVENLSKIYGSTAAIADVTFKVESGEILGFLGPNGAGKTTTMRILSGYLPATSGTAKIDGVEVHEDSMAVRQKIGYLPESPPLYPDMTVEGFLKFVAEIKGVPSAKRQERVDYALEKCNLLDRRKTLIKKLSKGYRQRVGIAQAIVHDPPVIILDEPTVGLDPKQIIDVRNLIKSLAGDHTVILSTHILPEVSMTCTKVAIINRGKIVATGSPETLMQQLVGGTSYDIEVAGTIDEVQNCLQTIRQIKEIQHGGDEFNRVRVKVLTDSNDDIGRDITTALVTKGLGLYSISRKQASLEDVFLELTAQETRQEMAVQETLGEIAQGIESVAQPENIQGAESIEVTEPVQTSKEET